MGVTAGTTRPRVLVSERHSCATHVQAWEGHRGVRAHDAAHPQGNACRNRAAQLVASMHATPTRCPVRPLHAPSSSPRNWKSGKWRRKAARMISCPNEEGAAVQDRQTHRVGWLGLADSCSGGVAAQTPPPSPPLPAVQVERGPYPTGFNPSPHRHTAAPGTPHPQQLQGLEAPTWWLPPRWLHSACG